MKDPRVKTENLICGSQYMQLHSSHGTNRRRMDSYNGPMEDEEILNDFNQLKKQKVCDDSDDKDSDSDVSYLSLMTYFNLN